VPLLFFALAQDLAFGDKVAIPFFKDYAAQLRFLVALPILLLAEIPIDHRWQTVAQEFLTSGVVIQDEIPHYHAITNGLMQLRNRYLPEILILVLAYSGLFFVSRPEALVGRITNWRMLQGGAPSPSLAGLWFAFISAPLFRFLLLRWIWRMSLWTVFLWRVSRLKLYLVATHTDLAAGLGFLPEGQRAYSPIVFAGGTVIAGSLLNAIRYEQETLASLKSIMIATASWRFLSLSSRYSSSPRYSRR